MTPMGAQRVGGSHIMLKRINSDSTASHNQSINVTFASENLDNSLQGAMDSSRSVKRQPSQVIGDMVVEDLEDDDQV